MEYLPQTIIKEQCSSLPISQMTQADAIEQIWGAIVSLGAVTGALEVYEDGSKEYKLQTAKVSLQVEMVRTQFSDLAPSEIKEAFQLAIGGNLKDVVFADAKKDIAKVLHAYRQHKAEKKRLSGPVLNVEDAADVENKNKAALRETMNYFKMLRRKYRKIGNEVYVKYNHNEAYWSIMYSILYDAKLIRLTKKVRVELAEKALDMAYNRLRNPLSHIDHTERRAMVDMFRSDPPEIHTVLQKESASLFRTLAIKYLIEH